MSETDLTTIAVTLEGLSLLEVEAFDALLTKEIAAMRLKGVSEQAIFQTLLNDAETNGRVFGTLASGIKSQMYGTISDAAKAGEEQYYLEQGIDTSLRKWMCPATFRFSSGTLRRKR